MVAFSPVVATTCPQVVRFVDFLGEDFVRWLLGHRENGREWELLVVVLLIVVLLILLRTLRASYCFGLKSARWEHVDRQDHHTYLSSR